MFLKRRNMQLRQIKKRRENSKMLKHENMHWKIQYTQTAIPLTQHVARPNGIKKFAIAYKFLL